MPDPALDPIAQQIHVRSDSPQLRIMISSTSLDLPEHRKDVMDAILRMGHFPLAMEHGTAVPDSDAVKLSLEMVDKAQVYIGIFAQRYGYRPVDPVRNPDNLSITELEYRRAVGRRIPILIYLSHEDHPFKAREYETDADSRAKLEALKASLNAGVIRGEFKSSDNLRALVVQSLSQLRVDRISPHLAPDTRPKPALPVPPEIYAVPPYTLTNTFVGRRSELDLLDQWAKSRDTIMVVEAIGGLGKSALTWEWMQNRAPSAIPNLAGRIWWSFYEKGTSMVTFVRHALAYVTAQDPEALTKDSSHYQRGQQLLAELRLKPYLLVLDGFERALTAYHRLDKAQIPDDQVDSDLRDCINPPDGELLTQLIRCTPSKILISTRLFPSHLEDSTSHKPITGVAWHKLNGLAPPDALDLMKRAGITGDEQEMLSFAAQFGRHSLLLRIVCGMIADYKRKPYDFDAWHADPIYGGGLKLSELDLKQRYTHILHYALRGLNDLTKKLLCRIAVISENATYETMAVLNPFLPPRPGEVNEPDDPAESWRWRGLSETERTTAQDEYKEDLAKYRQFEEAVRLYPSTPEYRSAVTSFDTALKELENRGLLQWDREVNRYEMHPVVRGYAAELLEADDRTDTFLKVRDHFASLPPDDLDKATEIAHVSCSIEIYKCLIGAGMLDEAARFYRNTLGTTLNVHVGAYSTILELLKPLFQNDFHGGPHLESKNAQSYFLNALSTAYSGLGREEDALNLLAKTFELDLAERSWIELGIRLRNSCVSRSVLGRRAEAAATLAVASSLAEASEDEQGASITMLFQCGDAVDEGRFDDADRLAAAFRQRKQPQVQLYRPGDFEICLSLAQFYQRQLTDAAWQSGFDLAVQHRNILRQHHFLALRAESDLCGDQPARAIEAIEQALQITKRLGTPNPHYHELRAWALARLGRADDAGIELEAGEEGLFAAETCLVLAEPERACECALNSYRWAWGDGPPYIHWYDLQRSRAILAHLGEPEPQLPPFDPAKLRPIPFEKEIREAIERLQAEKKKRLEAEGKDNSRGPA